MQINPRDNKRHFYTGFVVIAITTLYAVFDLYQFINEHTWCDCVNEITYESGMMNVALQCCGMRELMSFSCDVPELCACEYDTTYHRFLYQGRLIKHLDLSVYGVVFMVISLAMIALYEVYDQHVAGKSSKMHVH